MRTQLVVLLVLLGRAGPRRQCDDACVAGEAIARAAGQAGNDRCGQRAPNPTSRQIGNSPHAKGSSGGTVTDGPRNHSRADGGTALTYDLRKMSETEMLPYAHAYLALPDNDPRLEKLWLTLLNAFQASEDRDFHRGALLEREYLEGLFNLTQ